MPSGTQFYVINRISLVAKGEGVQVREMEVAISEEVPWHFHSEITDYCYCLKGTVRVELAGETEQSATTLLLSPGEKCIIPPNCRHRITCAAEDVATYLLIQAGGKYDFNLIK